MIRRPWFQGPFLAKSGANRLFGRALRLRLSREVGPRRPDYSTLDLYSRPINSRYIHQVVTNGKWPLGRFATSGRTKQTKAAAEGPKRSEGVSQPEPRRSSGLALPPCARWYSGSRAGWQGLAPALGTQVLQTQALPQRLEERAGAGPLPPRGLPWLS